MPRLGIELEDLNSLGKPRPWVERKEQGLAVAEAFEGIDADNAAKVRGCGTWLRFLVSRDAVGADCKQLNGANFCKSPHCPTCQGRKAMGLAYVLSACVAHLVKTKRLTPLMLTLTMKSMPGWELPEAYELMIGKAFRNLRGREVWKRACRYWFRSVETTFTAAGAHPHIHVLVLVEQRYFDKAGNLYITHNQWVEMWREVLGVDYRPSVRIERCRNIRELTKYVVKPSSYLRREGDDWVANPQILGWMHGVGRRFIGWSKALSAVRRELGLTGKETQDEDDIDLITAGSGVPEGFEPDHYRDYTWVASAPKRGKFFLSAIKPVDLEEKAALHAGRKARREDKARWRAEERDELRARGQVATRDGSRGPATFYGEHAVALKERSG